MAALEAAALSGELFNPRRSLSPARSLSTASEPNTDDELGSDISRPSSPHLPSHTTASSRGGAQTGPKGVINDRENQRHSDRIAQSAQRVQLVENQKKKTMIGVTSLEEDSLREKERLLKESEEDALAREQWRARRRAEIERGEKGSGEEEYRGHRRGGLREVGKEGFLSAVEKRGWTVVLIYESVGIVIDLYARGYRGGMITQYAHKPPSTQLSLESDGARGCLANSRTFLAATPSSLRPSPWPCRSRQIQ